MLPSSRFKLQTPNIRSFPPTHHFFNILLHFILCKSQNILQSTVTSQTDPSSSLLLIPSSYSYLLSPLDTFYGKASYHFSETFFRFTIGYEIIRIPEGRHSPFALLLRKPHSHSSHPPFHFFHHPIHVKLNSQVAMTHPCLTPLSLLENVHLQYFTLTQAKLLSYIRLISFYSLPPASYIVDTLAFPVVSHVSFQCP